MIFQKPAIFNLEKAKHKFKPPIVILEGAQQLKNLPRATRYFFLKYEIPQLLADASDFQKTKILEHDKFTGCVIPSREGGTTKWWGV